MSKSIGCVGGMQALNTPFASMPHFWQIPLSRLKTCARTLVDAYIPVDKQCKYLMHD